MARHMKTPIFWLALCLACSSVSITQPLSGAEPRVELEILLEPSAPVDAANRWIAMLKDLDFSNLKVRSGKAGDTPSLQQRGTNQSPYYAAVGIVTGGDILHLPGIKIRLGDKQALRDWKSKLQADGEEGILAQKTLYGLTQNQLLEVHDCLKNTITFSTKGEKSNEILKKIAASLPLQLTPDSSAAEAVKSQEPVLDELQGLSYGTALAAILRPEGCVFVPVKASGQKTKLVIYNSKEQETPWPVGWEIKTQPSKSAPEFYEIKNTEITDFVLADALKAIQERAKIPFLYDHNNILRQRVELDKVKVSSDKGRRSYARVVDVILAQAKLKAEMRVDEAERPFLWITTQKQQ
jgi:hypothetical protein